MHLALNRKAHPPLPVGVCVSAIFRRNWCVVCRLTCAVAACQDALSGNSKVMMFVNVSPASYNVTETLCSLNFAKRCRSVKLGQASKNQEAPEVAK